MTMAVCVCVFALFSYTWLFFFCTRRSFRCVRCSFFCCRVKTGSRLSRTRIISSECMLYIYVWVHSLSMASSSCGCCCGFLFSGIWHKRNDYLTDDFMIVIINMVIRSWIIFSHFKWPVAMFCTIFFLFCFFPLQF